MRLKTINEPRPPQYSVVRSESTVARQSQGVAPTTEFASKQIRHDFVPTFYRPQPSARSSQAASIVGRYNNVRSANIDGSILGSGDFLLIRGGTFEPEGSLLENGFGKEAHTSKLTRKEPHYPENPFETFKDFADIANDPAYSNIVVVYNNEGSTTTQHPKIKKSPKNIFEQLQLIDKENEEKAKISKSKTKLLKSKYLGKKKYGSKFESISPPSTTESYSDPLMAVN